MNAIIKPDAHLSPLRSGRLTGSRIGGVLGLNPHSTRADVLREMVRQHYGYEQEFQGNEMTRYGQSMEPKAIALYETSIGGMTHGGGDLILHPVHDFLAITPDGLVGDDGMIECKAPYRGTYTHWNEKPYYEAQMHLQMACASRKWCDFVVLDRSDVIHVSRLDFDPFWLPRYLPVMKAFMADYAEALLSPDAHLEPLSVERGDVVWLGLASAYATQDKIETDAKNEKARIKALMISEAAGKNVKGCGVTLIQKKGATTTAWSAVVDELLKGADLSKWVTVGKPSVSITVKESK